MRGLKGTIGFTHATGHLIGACGSVSRASQQSAKCEPISGAAGTSQKNILSIAGCVFISQYEQLKAEKNIQNEENIKVRLIIIKFIVMLDTVWIKKRKASFLHTLM